MPTIIRDGTNTARTVTAVQIRDGGNVARTISEIRVRDSNNVSRIVFSTSPALSVSASPTTVSGFTLGTGTATTDASTATAVGGTPPYTYAWTVVSFDNSVSPTALSPTSATSTFRQTNIGIAQDFSAVFRITVTDDLGATASTTINTFWSDTT